MSIVGSIGVVGGGFGFPGLLARVGVERRLYTAGARKARLDPFEPEREEDVAFARHLMEDIHGQFKQWVRSRRGARLTASEADLFDGRIYLGGEALGAGLIDAIGELDTLVRELGGERALARSSSDRSAGVAGSPACRAWPPLASSRRRWRRSNWHRGARTCDCKAGAPAISGLPPRPPAFIADEAYDCVLVLRTGDA